jgi:hypothetical protein
MTPECAVGVTGVRFDFTFVKTCNVVLHTPSHPLSDSTRLHRRLACRRFALPANKDLQHLAKKVLPRQKMVFCDTIVRRVGVQIRSMTRVQITLLHIINRRERLPIMKQIRAYAFGGFGIYFSKSKIREMPHSQSTTGRGQVLQNLTQVM